MIYIFFYAFDGSTIHILPIISLGSVFSLFAVLYKCICVLFQSVMKSALASLHSLLRKPVLLCGGGCWQTHVAWYIKQKVSIL
jgi:hypothetical protein